jgi:hypothetical protein
MLTADKEAEKTLNGVNSAKIANKNANDVVAPGRLLYIASFIFFIT